MATADEVESSRAYIRTLGFFQGIRVVLTFISGFVVLIWTNYFKLTDDGRLFPSLYFFW